MTALVAEKARAKINLTLSVLGRRPDGCHELLSLVAFADAADRVHLDLSKSTRLIVTGPFAADIAGPNLIETALQLVAQAAPGLNIGEVTLEKNLPVASGVGGGSADAAAVLRAIRSAHPELAGAIDWHSMAQCLGSDVPVCLADRPVWMSGAGERLHELVQPMPRLDAVLVNPLADVPADKTARVFRALAAPPLAAAGMQEFAALPSIPDRAELLALMRRADNDLQAPAIAVIPSIDTVLEALEQCQGAEIARISGAGPTCFAVFTDAAAAGNAARCLAAEHPEWWIRSTVIG